MAKTGILALTLVLMASTWTAPSAQTSSSCTNVLTSMSPCLNYITGSSSAPSSGCCSALASVVKSQPECLCQVISGSGSSSSLGISINRTQALQLPTACKVQTPSLTRCSGAASPSGSPSTTNTPSSDNSGSTTAPTTSTSTGSKDSPSVDTSEGGAMKAGLALFFAMFFIVSLAN